MLLLRKLIGAALLFSFVVRLNAIEMTRQQAGKVAQVVGRILENAHYQQYPFDDEMSRRFLMSYLDALDYNHLVFLQSDVDELMRRYGTSLDNLTTRADASPAFEVFGLYLRRLQERQQLVARLIGEDYDFTKDESFIPSRNKLPWPASGAEVEDLWRKRVKYELLQGRLSKDAPEETRRVIGKRYERLLRNMQKLETEEILQSYLTALAHCYDPHSDYMSPREAENFDINNIKLKLIGIGALLRSEDGYAKIVSLVPGGPADLSKQLKPNDRIVEVAQGDQEPVDVVEETLSKVVDLIRGEMGTVVKLTIMPADAADGSTRRVVSLVRDEIQLKEQFGKARIVEEPLPDGSIRRLGVITLPQFYADCASDVSKLVRRLEREEVEGILLDLRRNGGGILGEAVDLTGLFVGKGPVVQVKHPKYRPVIYRANETDMIYGGPLVVLVGRMSASASEIVAAALQDYDRAVILGDQATHGKGTVQSLVRLGNFLQTDQVPDPGEIKLTVQKFYRIAGGTTQKNGVTPDIILPSILDYLDIGESSLPNCMPADTIEGARYRTLNLASPYLGRLRQLSIERVSMSKDFAYLHQDIERVRRQQLDKSISLDEQKRLQEKKEQEERQEARRKERESRPAELLALYDIDLDLVAKDLPARAVSLTTPEKTKSEVLAPDSEEATSGESDVGTDEGSELRSDTHLKEAISILNDYVSLMKASSGGNRPEALVSSPQALLEPSRKEDVSGAKP